MMLTAISILMGIGSIFAFKMYKTDGGTFFCQYSEGPCTSTIKYKIAEPPWYGQLLYCNDGAGSTICNNALRVVEDNN